MRSNPKSVPPPSSKKLSKDDAKLAILKMARDATRPLLVGVAAVRLGSCWSLEETEELFFELQHEGKVRPINKIEREVFDLRDGFVLTGVNSGA